NPSYFATPTAACAHNTAGASGPDRISRTSYDILGRPVSVISGYGTALATLSQTTYTQSGKVETLTDAAGNKTTYEYDGFHRLVRTRHPDPSTPGTSSSTDHAWITYATNGRISSITLRDGNTITPDYDAYGRMDERVIGSGGG